MNKRITEIDVLKGIGISLMVFNHVGWGSLVHTYIQSFHMPLFFLVNGYLWKKSILRDTVLKRIKTLMIPYVLFSVLYITLIAIANYVCVGKLDIFKHFKAILLFPTDMNNMPIAPALWFLPCMFIVDIVYSFLSNKLSYVVKIILIMVISLSIMIFSCCSKRMLPFALEPVAAGLLFMLIGDLTKKYYPKVVNEGKWSIMVATFIIEAILAFLNESVDMRSARYHKIALYMINGTMGTCIYLWIAKRFSTKECQFQKVITKCLTYFSINGVAFLCMNQAFILVFERVMDFNTDSALTLLTQKGIIFIFTLGCCIGTNELILHTRFKFILGR